MEYKYEDVQNVEVKKEFEVYRYDEDTEELTGTFVIKEGTKGEIVSMGWSSSDGFRRNYDILFDIDGNEVEVNMYESKMEECLNLSLPQAIESTESTSETGAE